MAIFLSDVYIFLNVKKKTIKRFVQDKSSKKIICCELTEKKFKLK